MVDLKYVRDNLAAVKQNIANRNMKADADAVVRLYEERNATIAELEKLRKDRNDNAAKMKGKLEPAERTVLIDEGRGIKERIAVLEPALEACEKALNAQAMLIPNMVHPEAPVGLEEKDSVEVSRHGSLPRFDFAAKDHVQLGEELDLIDFETATRVSGTKFYYLKNQAVVLEMALVRYALDILQKRGFTPFVTPDVAREEVLEGIGFNPRGEESNIYPLEGTGTCLVGTAEITLGGYYGGQILDKSALPVRMAGLSHCFRREAGAAGQYSKGLYRVHQFTKLEMFILCEPAQSDAMHQELLEIEKEIFIGLEIPFRVLDICTGDLGAPAYRKYDLEAWMPGRGEGDWGEITSTSNCTDFQSRRLGIRYRDEGKNQFVHMLNGTAVACSRALIALIENGQQADGSIRMPKALVPYTGFAEIPARAKA